MELGQRYGNAKTEAERLQIGIQAIDRGIICHRCKIEDLDAVFGTNFSKIDKRTMDDKGLLNEVVWFSQTMNEPPASEQQASKEAPSSASIAGWRLEVQFYESGNIKSYSLTNMDKF